MALIGMKSEGVTSMNTDFAGRVHHGYLGCSLWSSEPVWVAFLDYVWKSGDL